MANLNVYVKKGDAIKMLESNMADVLVHGCNCFCTMNSGIAKSIRAKFPKVYEVDKTTVSGDKSKLGTYTYAEFKNDTPILKGRKIYIVNAYTQYTYGNDGKCRFEYDAFEKIMKDLDIKFAHKLIVMPWIGCGLAGGDRNKVKEILDRVIRHSKVCICEL